MNWETAKALAILFIVAVPGLMILTHLVAWIVRRLKAAPPPPPKPWPTPVKPGYGSVDEFRRDAELLSVGDVLDRAAGTAPPRNRALEERKQKAEETTVPCAHPAEAKPGRWYRRSAGPLVILVDTKGCPQGFGRFLESGTERPVLVPFSEVGAAWPRRGEWWLSRACTEHVDGPDVVHRPVCVPDDLPDLHARVLCGCAVPSNFGKGTVEDNAVHARERLAEIQRRIGTPSGVVGIGISPYVPGQSGSLLPGAHGFAGTGVFPGIVGPGGSLPGKDAGK